MGGPRDHVLAIGRSMSTLAKQAVSWFQSLKVAYGGSFWGSSGGPLGPPRRSLRGLWNYLCRETRDESSDAIHSLYCPKFHGSGGPRVLRNTQKVTFWVKFGCSGVCMNIIAD